MPAPQGTQPVGPAPAPQPVADETPLFAAAADALRVPASNAKLLTTTAGYLALSGRYRFVTEVGVRGGRIYLRGTGDPVLRRSDLKRMARAVRARGVRAVRGIRVDDSYFGRRQLAPGFDAFHAGSYYRPTSSALNVDANAVVIKVSAPKNRRRPRVDVLPPSDYVKVRKLVRYVKQRRRGRPQRKARVKVSMRRRGAIMWLTVSGTMPRGGKTISTRRAVYDPAFNVGWAFRRALVEAGINVTGVVGRGRWPKNTRRLARRVRSLREVLRITNTHSDNLAAENLVRAMGHLAAPGEPATKGRKKDKGGGEWTRGLARLNRELAAIGIEGFYLGNGSGLHRRSRVSARMLVTLLQRIYNDAKLRRVLLPTLAVAGRSGTLSRRLRNTDAEGLIHAKTGTLGNALALSGLVGPEQPQPLAFSIIVNGRANRAARNGIDRIALLLARYVSEKPLADPPEVEDQPATQPQGS